MTSTAKAPTQILTGCLGFYLILIFFYFLLQYSLFFPRLSSNSTQQQQKIWCVYVRSKFNSKSKFHKFHFDIAWHTYRHTYIHTIISRLYELTFACSCIQYSSCMFIQSFLCSISCVLSFFFFFFYSHLSIAHGFFS